MLARGNRMMKGLLKHEFTNQQISSLEKKKIKKLKEEDKLTCRTRYLDIQAKLPLHQLEVPQLVHQKSFIASMEEGGGEHPL